jgi:phosphate transport system protein
MRNAFHEELDLISDQLVEMTRLVSSAMERATVALLDADLVMAESVIAADERVDGLRADLDRRAVDLLARQQPVATELRMVVSAMHMASELERMGDLARHVAKVARLRYPASAVPAEVRGTVVEMSQVASRIVAKAGSIVAAKDLEAATSLHRDDDEMDRLHLRVFTMLLGEHWPHGIPAAVDITLLARYYERFADHAVAVARLVVYLVTGEWDHEEPPTPAASYLG